MASEKKLEYDLLDLLAEFPATGDPSSSYKLMVKRLAEEWYPVKFSLFVLKEYTGIEDEELSYAIYDSNKILNQYDQYQNMLTLPFCIEIYKL